LSETHIVLPKLNILFQWLLYKICCGVHIFAKCFQFQVIEDDYLVGPSGKNETDTTVDVPTDNSFATDDLPESSRPGGDIADSIGRNSQYNIADSKGRNSQYNRADSKDKNLQYNIADSQDRNSQYNRADSQDRNSQNNIADSQDRNV